MIFYRLAIERIIEYLHLRDIFKENEYRLMLLHRKPKETYRYRLQTNQTMNLCISVLLSIISLLVCVTIPYAALESPTEQLKSHELHTFYAFACWLQNYMPMIDRAIIALSVILVFIWVKTLWDGVKSTDIKKSPWLERGKYVLPEKKPL